MSPFKRTQILSDPINITKVMQNYLKAMYRGIREYEETFSPTQYKIDLINYQLNEGFPIH